ncbi:hypothetical protein BJY04DRAFT_224284 [Aspergillus karnatakaensis]|uniref:uncharacterized protein n=1 Tax=Aspergillus karnatakaensis TaxID=1810916 RepID=UPI003CCE3BE2
MPKRKRDATTKGENGHNDSSSDWPKGGQNLVEVLPGITRKITACAACRKNKIRCDMPDDGPPCVRCRRRGLSCVLNRSLQSLIEDTKNVQLMQTDITNLHEALHTLCHHLGLDGPKALASTRKDRDGSYPPEENDQGAAQQEEEGCEVSPPESPSAVHAPIDTFLDITKIRSPNSIDSPPSARASRSGTRSDLISKGIITATVAERLVQHYFSRLDHYLYGIAGEYQGLEQLRTSAPILLAAICTVSALHDPQDRAVYEACNREFRSLVARSTFEKRDIDYIRALCISSFWLADASRIFCSDAIRRAADMRLHRSFDALFDNQTGLANPAVPGVPSPSSQNIASATDRVRLWYLLFVCDQHLSILHNRDPLLRNEKGIAVGWESYLHRAEASESDVRILSQVSLLLIMGQVRDVLGSDNQTPLPPALASQILNYSRQLDKWYTKFSGLFVTNAFIGEFPKRGLQLHYQFGKLYLGHQVFKGLHGRPIPPHFLTAATMAHDTAVAIFEMIVGEAELQEGLVGMPHYFHVMIAFAGHLLLEICQNYYEQLGIKLQDDFQLINSALRLFRNTPCIPQHPIWRMTHGLNRKLHDCASAIGMAVPSATASIGGLNMPSLMPNQQPEPLFYPPVPGTNPQTQPLDEFLFTDFGEFNFPDLTSNFMT